MLSFQYSLILSRIVCIRLETRERPESRRSSLQRYGPEINIIFQFPFISCNISKQILFIPNFRLSQSSHWMFMDWFYLLTCSGRMYGSSFHELSYWYRLHCMQGKKNRRNSALSELGRNINAEGYTLSCLLSRCSRRYSIPLVEHNKKKTNGFY